MSEEKQIFSMEMDAALRQEASAARLRVDPAADLALLHSELAKQGNKLILTDTGLVVEGHEGISARDLLLAASKAESTKANFVTPGSKLRHTSELSEDKFERAKQATAYIRENGEQAWLDLCAASRKPVLRSDVVIGPSMCAEDWKNLTPKEKVQAVKAFGPGADRIVAQICNRKGPKK